MDTITHYGVVGAGTPLQPQITCQIDVEKHFLPTRGWRILALSNANTVRGILDINPNDFNLSDIYKFIMTSGSSGIIFIYNSMTGWSSLEDVLENFCKQADITFLDSFSHESEQLMVSEEPNRYEPLDLQPFQIKHIINKFQDYSPPLSKNPLDVSKNIFETIWPFDRNIRERMYCIAFQSNAPHDEPIGIFEVSSGGLAATVCDLRLLFAQLITLNADSFMLCHNHPSGQPNPSSADKLLQSKVESTSESLGIQCLGHYIYTPDGEFHFSF